MYRKYVKRILDIVLSGSAILTFLPLFAVIAIWIKLDSPGPVFFRQTRIGIHKTTFEILKFRTMKKDAPSDVPTHLLSDSEVWITKAGRILRKTSLDEIPQVWNIWEGKMSVIGPRPALWNQDDLVAERDKYGANDVRPGLTGWAQINGRDELEIPVKAKLDGEYVKKLRQGGLRAFAFDCRCFIGTIFSVARGDGVVEGGTGELHKRADSK